MKKKTISDFNRTVSFSIPHGWILSSFNEVIDLVKGKKPIDLGEQSESRLFAYIIIESFEKQVYHQYTSAINCPVCKNKDILIVWDGARCGLIGRGVNGSIGSTLAKINNYGLHSSYLYYFLQTKYGLINKNPRGIGIPHIDPEVFWTINIPIPPLPEQHRIVIKIEELLTQLDAGVASLKKVQAQLKRYRQAVLKAAFEGRLTLGWREKHKGEIEPAGVLLERIKKINNGTGINDNSPMDLTDLTALPENWIWTRLDNLTHIKGGITKDGKRIVNEGRFVPYLRVANVQNGYLDLNEIKFIEASEVEIRELSLKKGDILFTEGGDRDKLGRGWIWYDELPECIYQNHIFRARIYLDEISSKYISWFGNTHSQKYFMKKGKQTTNLASINLTQLRAFPVALPPVEEQRAIVLEIEHHLSQIDHLEKTIATSLRQAETLRQSILKQAFEGRLVPQDPNDEPASVLLERIKSEKARHAAGTKKGKTLQPKSPKRKVRNVN